ncbi:hypothetical protein Tco_0955352 [Tanacetum coccineum]|uniref:CCHC-type domain-containing protein n=1 Tax=Tanacetum coccineum TaxID=301880 RepID=A0ABQ5E723_9ASTR
MSTFVRCVGCGEPLYGHPCRWCTCERCGNDLRDGYCFLCHSRNEDSFTYDSTPNSFDNPPDFSYPPPQPQFVPYSCELCGNDDHYGYDCPPQHPVIHQPIQEKTCAELLAEERAANIDQSPPQEMSIQDMEDLKQHYLDEMKSLINDLQIKDYRNERIDIQYRRECEIRIYELKQNFNGMIIEIRKMEKELLQQEQAAYVSTSQRFNFIYDDDNDEESSIPLSDVISELPPCIAITPVLSTVEPIDSLIMEDEHLDTTPATESDELIDDDESCHEEVIHEMSFKTYSNPLFDLDEETISSEEVIHNEDPDSTPKNDRFDAECTSSDDESFFRGGRSMENVICSLISFDHVKEIVSKSDDYDSEGDDIYSLCAQSFHVDYPELGDSTINVVEDIHVDGAYILPTIHHHMDFDYSFSNDTRNDLMFLPLSEIEP